MPDAMRLIGTIAFPLIAAASALTASSGVHAQAGPCNAMLGEYSVAAFGSPKGLDLLAAAVMHRDDVLGTPAFRLDNEGGQVKHRAPLGRSVSRVEPATPAEDHEGAVFAAVPAGFVTCSYRLGDDSDQRVIQVDWSAMNAPQIARFAADVGQTWEAVLADAGARSVTALPPGNADHVLDARSIIGIRHFISLPIRPEGADRRLVFIPLHQR